MAGLNIIPFIELTTPRLLLRRLRIDDAEEIFQLRSDEKVNELIDRVTASSIKDIYDFINKIIDIQNNNEGMIWAITLKDAPKLVGTIGCWNIVKEKDE